MKISNQLFSIIIISLIFTAACITVTSADTSHVFVYGSEHDYSAVVVPNHGYVHQGENISQGNYYDLSGVYGFSGILAWWSNSNNIGYTYPDKTFDLSRLPKRTLMNFYITPSDFPVGEWYQLDHGYQFNNDSSRSKFGGCNDYAFYVVGPVSGTIPEVQETAIAPTPQVTVIQLKTKAPTAQETPIETPGVMIITMTQQDSAIPGIEQVTPKTPINPLIPIIGIIVGIGIYLSAKRQDK